MQALRPVVSSRRAFAISAACVATLLASVQASAANVWDGGAGDTLWSSPGNWDNDLVPTFPVGLTFAGDTHLASVNDLAAPVVNGLAFAAGAGAFTLSGVAISLGGDIDHAGTSLQTLALPIALTAGRTVLAPYGDITLSGSVSGAFDLNKRGAGTLTLSGVHTYTGRTGVGSFPNGTGMVPSTHQGGGTLVLDFSAAGSPASNLIYNGLTPAAAQELRLSSGELVLQGKAATDNSQTVGQLGIATGFNSISLRSGAGGKIVLNLGAIIQAAGSSADNNKSSLVNFELPAGTQDATNGVTTSSLNTNGILTPISGNIANLVVNGSSWAANATNTAGGNLVGLPDASYTPSTATTTGANTQNVDMVTDVVASNPTAWTLRFNNTGVTGPRTLTNTNTGATMAINGGGILVTPGMGADDVTISGGSIRGSSNRGLFISNYNTGGGSLIINANVVNNANSNALTLGGGGVVRLNGTNTYTNGTYVLRDTTLVVSSDANLGFGSGAVSVASASTSSNVITLAAAAPTNGSWIVGASVLGSTITAISGTTITLAGNANADIATPTSVSYASAPALNLDGGTLRAAGTFALRRTHPADVSGVGGDAISDRRIGISGQGGVIEVVADASLTVHGVVSSQTTRGFGALTKTGPGMLVFTAANTYSGGTTISSGTLALSGAGRLGSGPVKLATGATLDLSALSDSSYTFAAGLSGAGTIHAPAKTVSVTGALTPLGRLQITGDATLGANADGTFGVSASAHDSFAVSGHLALAGDLAVTPAEGFVFAGGASHDLYDAATVATGLASVTVNGLALVNTSGVWTATDSGLSYTFTESTGVLAVSSGSSATALETWRATHFGDPANSGSGADLADPDGDGVANLLEYATGTLPLVASAPATQLGVASGRLTLTYARIADPALTYTVQATNDLAAGPWTTLAVEGNPSTGSANVAGSVTVTDTVATTAQPRRFLRLHVGY